MSAPRGSAVARRDSRLARTRRVSLLVAGGAAAASLGLGTAFAHAIPGHGPPATLSRPGPAAPAAQPGQRHAGQRHAGHRAGTGRRRQLRQPAQPPQPPPSTPAAPVVVSGGS